MLVGFFFFFFSFFLLESKLVCQHTVIPNIGLFFALTTFSSQSWLRTDKKRLRFRYHCIIERIGEFFFFFQINTHFQTVSLVSIVPKLFRKLTSQVFQARVHCSNSSINDLISIKIHGELESSTKENQEIQKYESRVVENRDQQWRKKSKDLSCRDQQ